MKIYLRKKGNKKVSDSSIPNVFAFTFIRNFLTDKNYEDTRREYLISNLNNNQINQAMKDVKWLFKEYKGLDIITIENNKNEIKKFVL